MLRFSLLARNLITFKPIKNRSVEYKPHELDDSFGDLLERMQMALELYKSLRIPGITASQLGVDKRVLLMRSDPQLESKNFLWLVNPYITSWSHEEDLSLERSLSNPDIECIVPRAHRIIVYGIHSTQFDESNFTFIGKQAWFMQHLIDHLNGVDFVEKAVQINKAYWHAPMNSPRVR